MVTENLTKGSSNEEEYFYKANRELIERKQGELDSEREKKASQERKCLAALDIPIVRRKPNGFLTTLRKLFK